MRATTAFGLVCLGVLSLDCGGTFCDEFPEACGVAGGGNSSGGGPSSGAGNPGGGSVGGGGTGGAGGEAPVGPFDVTVSLVDFAGDFVNDAPVLVSSPEGGVLEITDTGASGSVAVSVPNHGRVSLFHDTGSQKQVFSAEVVEGSTEITYRVPASTPGPAVDANISAACSGNCGLFRELSVSCHNVVGVADTSSPFGVTITNNLGCPDASTYKAFIVAYDVTYRPVAASTLDGLAEGVQLHTLPEMSVVKADEDVNITLEIEGLLGGFVARRDVIAAYDARPGFGYSRGTDSLDPAVVLQLVKAFVPNAWASFAIATTPRQRVLRYEPVSSIDVDSTIVFDVDSLAIPEIPENVDLTMAGQPLALFELGDGPLGDAMQLVLHRDTSIAWFVALPAATSGDVLLPGLPAALEQYALTEVDDYVIAHVDSDDVAGYAAWTNELITPPAERPSRSQTQAVSQ